MSALALSDCNADFSGRGDDLRYWGLAGSNFPKFRYENGRVVSPYPETTMRISGWCEHLSVDQVDTLVCYGFHISPSYLTRMIVRTVQKHYGISQAVRAAVREAMLEDWWVEQSGRQIMEGIRRDFPEKQLIYYSHPHVAEGFGFFDGLDEGQVLDTQRTVLQFLKRKIMEIGVIYREQPNITIVDDVYTAKAFNTGAVKYGTDGEPHDHDDFRHMNALYGDHILRDILELVG